MRKLSRRHGLKAVEEAIEVLEKFYKKAAKSEVDLSLAQGPKEDAPDAGFEGGEAYAGDKDGATGALGLLEVIKGDFKRTATETEKAEAEAAENHDVFLTESGKSLKEKEKAKEKQKEKHHTKSSKNSTKTSTSASKNSSNTNTNATSNSTSSEKNEKKNTSQEEKKRLLEMLGDSQKSESSEK